MIRGLNALPSARIANVPFAYRIRAVVVAAALGTFVGTIALLWNARSRPLKTRQLRAQEILYVLEACIRSTDGCEDALEAVTGP